MSDVVAAYFDEPTYEELLARLKRSLEQVLAGDSRSALEFLSEIDNELEHDAKSPASAGLG